MKMENKCEPSFEALVIISAADDPSDSQSVFTITEKAPVPTGAFTFKTLLRHFPIQALIIHGK